MKNLIKERGEKIEQVEDLKSKIFNIENQIEKKLKDQIKERGETTIHQEGYKIKVKYPVNVRWDEKQLNEVANKIRSYGDDPERYIKFKPQVSEKDYKKWEVQIQRVFQPARTTSIGKRKIEIKEE